MDFDVERGYDRVVIGFGEHTTDPSARIADLTGRAKLKRLVSRNAKLWIQFNTDRTGTRMGFDMRLMQITWNNGKRT